MNVRTDGSINSFPLCASSGHVPLHVLWAFAKGRGQLSGQEQTHIGRCNRCSLSLQICDHAQNFGSVLREMHREHGPLAEGKPKLKTLYILQELLSPDADTARRRTD